MVRWVRVLEEVLWVLSVARRSVRAGRQAGRGERRAGCTWRRGGGGGSSTGAGSSTDAPLDVAPGAGARLAAGTRVRLEGLVAMAELNGRRGVVLRFDESKQRHVVSIRRGDEAEEFAVRRENLVVRSS